MVPFFFCTHSPLPFSTSQAATLWLRVCTPSGQCQVPLLPEPLPDGAPLQCPGQKPLRHSAPASNKPQPAEKSTPVWLAIWRTWAGFANSQLLPNAAALSSMQGLPRSGNFSAQTSASLHPPAALRLRILPFTRTWSSTVCAEEFSTPREMPVN